MKCKVEFRCPLSNEVFKVREDVIGVQECVCPSHITLVFEDRQEMHPVEDLVLVVFEVKEEEK